MSVQFHYSISCKRVSDSGWVTAMRAEHGEIPMSIVQPRQEVDSHSQAVETSETLTTEPMVQEISDTSVITVYLRGLNRRPGWDLAWHNDQVIWNLSLRLGKMEVGQEAKVRISYFATEGIGSGGYEIKLIDAFPDDTSTKTATQESGTNRDAAAISPTPETARKTGNPAFSSPPSANRKENVGDADTPLATRLENLQDQLMMVRKTLHEALERIERLEAKSRPPSKVATLPNRVRQRPPDNTSESTESTAKQPVTSTTKQPVISTAKQPATSTTKQPVTLPVDTQPHIADTEDDADAPDLFEFLAQSQNKPTPAKKKSTGNDNVKNAQKKSDS